MTRSCISVKTVLVSGETAQVRSVEIIQDGS